MLNINTQHKWPNPDVIYKHCCSGLGFLKCPEVQVPRLLNLRAESRDVSLSFHCDDPFHQVQLLFSPSLLSVHFLLFFSVILLFSPVLPPQLLKITILGPPKPRELTARTGAGGLRAFISSDHSYKKSWKPGQGMA